MAKKFSAPTGIGDFLPEDHDYFTFIKKIIRHRFRQAGFRRISPPVFEDAELFERSLGKNCEVFSRELYTFSDRQGRSYSLRPEITTGVVRAFIEHDLHKEPLPSELYYIERCFRYEHPKQRTKRQFWQFGAEILGETDPSIDAQIIYLGHQILEDISLRSQVKLKINTLGNAEDQAQFFTALEHFYRGKEKHLSEVSREKLSQKRYFELLEPQNEDEEILVQIAPKVQDHLSVASRERFEEMLDYLNQFEIEYSLEPSLVRSLGYYQQTIFEFQEKSTNDKLLVGGRYDGLLEKLGGPKLGACGFASGIERLMSYMKQNGVEVPHKDTLQVFVAATGKIAKKQALPILVKLRKHGYHAIGALGKTNMSEQLKRAVEFNVPFTLLIGDEEVKKKQIIVRNMDTGKQEWIDQENVLPVLDKLLGAPTSLDSTMDFLGHE